MHISVFPSDGLCYVIKFHNNNKFVIKTSVNVKGGEVYVFKPYFVQDFVWVLVQNI